MYFLSFVLYICGVLGGDTPEQDITLESLINYVNSFKYSRKSYSTEQLTLIICGRKTYSIEQLTTLVTQTRLKSLLFTVRYVWCTEVIQSS